MMNAAVMWSSSAIDVVDGTIPPADIICQDDSGNVVMSGDSFPVGTTTVTCRANDTAQNEASTMFNITVVGTYCLDVLLLKKLSLVKIVYYLAACILKYYHCLGPLS